MKFIELHEVEEAMIRVNPAYVIAYRASRTVPVEGSLVVVAHSDLLRELYVIETYDQITQKIEEAQA